MVYSLAMHEQDLAIVKALVSVAWADGVFAEREQEMLGALLDAYGAGQAEREELQAYASQKRSIDDIDPQQLSAADRRVLLQHAVLLTYADGDQSQPELELLAALAAKLRIPEAEAKELLATAGERAKKSLDLL
jgi:uncharacterized tellurite resistance protein B-like protein